MKGVSIIGKSSTEEDEEVERNKTPNKSSSTQSFSSSSSSISIPEDCHSTSTMELNKGFRRKSTPPSGIENRGFAFHTHDDDYNTNRGRSFSAGNEMVDLNVNMNLGSMIPQKPQPQLGSYDRDIDHFYSNNSWKKKGFLGRGEKLYVTKKCRKKEETNCCRIFMGMLLSFFLVAAAVVVVLILAGVIDFGKDSDNNSMDNDPLQQMGNSDFPPNITTSPSTTEMPTEIVTESTTVVSFTSIYMTNAIEMEFAISNLVYIPQLGEKNSSEFQNLSLQIIDELSTLLKSVTSSNQVSVKILSFSSSQENVYTRLQLAWDNLTYPSLSVKAELANLSEFGKTLKVKQIRFYEVRDACLFSNGGCSHECKFVIEEIAFACFCPGELVLLVGGKFCGVVTTTEKVVEVIEDEVTTVSPEEVPQEVVKSSSTTTTTTTTTTPTTTTIKPPVITQNDTNIPEVVDNPADEGKTETEDEIATTFQPDLVPAETSVNSEELAQTERISEDEETAETTQLSNLSADSPDSISVPSNLDVIPEETTIIPEESDSNDDSVTISV